MREMYDINLKDSKPPMDWDHLRLSVEQDENLLAQMIEIFLDQCPKSLRRLQKAIASQNTDDIEQAAHALKGILSHFGQSSAKSMANNIENMARAGRMRRSHCLFDALAHEVTHMLSQMSLMWREIEHERCID